MSPEHTDDPLPDNVVSIFAAKSAEEIAQEVRDLEGNLIAHVWVKKPEARRPPDGGRINA